MKKYANTIANAMESLVKSPEYKDLFGTYKQAGDLDYRDQDKLLPDYESPEEEEEHEHDMECDKGNCPEQLRDKRYYPPIGRGRFKRFDENFSDDEEMSEKDMKACAAYAVAIDSLLTASAALDSVGDMEYGSTLSLKLASLVSEAKKEKEMSKAEKMQAMRDAKKTDKQKADDAKAKEKEKALKAKEAEKAKAAKEKAKAKAKK